MTKLPNIELSYHEWTVADYHKLAELGILSEKRVELLSGEIINMSPVGKLHAAHVKHLAKLFWKIVGEKMIISVQDPIVVDDSSEPEPDVAILNWDERSYADRLPEAKDVVLLVEVADTTLEKDQKLKLPLYAQAGIQEYWIINLVDDTLEQYTHPKGAFYGVRQIYKKEDTLQHDLLGELRLDRILI
ncbi:MAG: Uma2 family endonuclease [Saprospiraceae bacterium]